MTAFLVKVLEAFCCVTVTIGFGLVCGISSSKADGTGFYVTVYYGNESDGWIQVPEEKEWEPSQPAPNLIYGAPIVTNRNDTDSDKDEVYGFPQNDEDEYDSPVKKGAGNGRDEVDILKVVVTLPPNAWVSLFASAGMRFWADPEKETPFGPSENMADFWTSDDFESWTLYVESTSESSSLNDQFIEFNEYWSYFEYDRVRITSIWAEPHFTRVARTYYSPVTRVDDHSVDVITAYEDGDQICIYDDNGTFNTATNVFCSNVTGSVDLGNGLTRVTVADEVPQWVGVGDQHAQGLSRFNNDLATRTSLKTIYQGNIGSSRTQPLAAWGIEICFHATPAGITRAKTCCGDDVRFDSTRQAYARLVSTAGNTGTHPWTVQHGKVYAPDDEDVNDDPFDTDEDVATWNTFTQDFNFIPHDHLYSIDAPGPTVTDNFRLSDRKLLRGNFCEFIRVKFDGDRPLGNSIAGTRCSPKLKWRTCVDLIANPNSQSSKIGPNGETLYYAMKNPNAPNVEQLEPGRSGEPGNDFFALHTNNEVKLGWLRFQNIISLSLP